MSTGRFSEFVDEVVHIRNEEYKEDMNWNFYLHKVQNPEMTYQDFLDEIDENEELQNMTEEDKTSALQTAFDILGNFNPLQEKG